MTYDDKFYAAIAAGSIRSATAVAPIVHSLTRPASIVDVGCGQGHWLRAFADLGVDHVVGYDGDHIDRARLAFPVADFHAADLAVPLEPLGRFDLALSLEVAEHLPAERADGFIAELTHAADIVLFSAAIPGQGGAGHVNEQWPVYWADRFNDHGFAVTGALRWLIWDDVPRIETWYVQNLLLAVKNTVLPTCSDRLRALFAGPLAYPYAVVHPALWDYHRSNP